MIDSIALQVGIDWADEKHDFCMAAPEQNKPEQGVFKSDPVSVHSWIKDIRNRYPQGRIQVCLELSKGPVVEMLKEYDYIDIYPINPITASSYRESLYPSLTKDDPMDAFLIFEILRHHVGKLHKLDAIDEDMFLLEGFCEDRRKTINKRSQVVNEIIATLKTYYPQAIKMIGNVTEKMSRAFLRRWPDWQTLSKARPQTLQKFYYMHQSRSEKRIKERIVILTISRALTNNSAVIKRCKTKLLNLLDQLESLEKSVKNYDKLIHEIYVKMDKREVTDSLPGAGKVFAPRLYVALSNYTNHCENAQDLATYSGVAPVRQRSGKSHRIGKRFRVPKFLHQTFVEFAHWSISHSQWAKAYYQHHKKVLKESHWHILRNLAFKWIRILFRCWKDAKPYDENTHIQSLKKQGSPIASML